MSNHDDRYDFDIPTSMLDAKTRKRALERDIMNIERQLADTSRRDKKGRLLKPKDYIRWRSNARSSLIFKKVEQAYLKDWIIERRRHLQANKLGIYEADDPRELLAKTRAVLRELLDGKEAEDTEAGTLFDIIEQYLHHAA